MSPYPKDETLPLPGPREDRITWRPRADGGADAELDLEAPNDLAGTVEVGAVTLEDGRIRVHLRVRPPASPGGVQWGLPPADPR